METPLAAYLPQDRRHALAAGAELPEHTHGAALFADISGFTPLTEALANQLGARRGAEVLTVHLDCVYDALIAQVERYGGSVLGFAGDSITCWFTENDERGTMIDEDGEAPSSFIVHRSSFRVVACALALQDAMRQFATIALPDGTATALALKVAVASGPARRLVVGDPDIQLLDTLAGATVARTASAEQLARPGEVLLDTPTAEALVQDATIAEWRVDEQTGERFAVLSKLQIEEPPAETQSAICNLQSAMARPWLLPAVYEHERGGQGAFLTELRPAVALFVRFAGLDYDDGAARDQLDAFIRRAQAVLARYEGTLLQLTIGDKGSYLYAAFGAPTAHEDDARRAVSAALDLRAPAADLGFLAPIQVGLSRGVMRAGACGSSTRRTYAVLGDDVNLAARLMGLAAPGEILVSGRVQSAVAEVFASEPRPPIALKGKAEPLPVFAVTGAQQRRAIRLQEPSYALPMIGRRRELAAIEDKLALAAQGHGQVVGIVAEAGMGKSRLLAEAIRLAHRRSFAGYGGACQSDGVNTPYLVWRPIWSAIFDLDRAAPLRKQVRVLEGELEERAPERVDALPLLGTLLGLSLPDNDFTRGLAPRERKSALHALLLDCLASAAREAASEGGGLLLALEDLHWIDPASHDLLEEVARICATLPMLIVLAYRPPELLRLQAPRVEALEHFTKVMLPELSEAEAAQAIRAKLAQLFPARTGAVPPMLLARLTAKAQGNPFYLEELLNYLHDRGIDPREAAALDQIDLSDSLHSLILSRIDQLSAQQQLTLKVASVIGRQFSFSHLRGYEPGLGEAEPLKADLDELARLELTPLDTPEPELAYLFKHIVTHEVAYESLAYATRASLHEQYARFVEAQAGEELSRYLALLAYHYDRSANLPKRREYLRRAGEAAQTAYANDAALDYYTRLLPLLTEVREQLEIHAKAAAVLDVAGRFAEAEVRLREALALPERPNAAAARVRCQHALAMILLLRGMHDAALACEQQARAAWEALSDQAGLCQVLIGMGRIYTHQGDHAAAERHLEEGLALARAAGDIGEMAQALGYLGMLALYPGDFTAARTRFEESLALRRAEGNTFDSAWALFNLGSIAASLGDYAAGLALLEESIELFRAVGSPHGLAAALGDSGYFALVQGDIALARARTEECLALYRAMDNKVTTASALGMLGAVELAEGDTAAARARGEASLAMYRNNDDKFGIAWTLGFVLGAVALEEGDTATARTLYEQGLALFRAVDRAWGSAEYIVSLGLVAWIEGQLDQAEALFADGLAQFHTLGVKWNTATGLAALALAAAGRATGAQMISFAERAARLGGATTALLEALGAPLDRQFRKPYEHAIASARAILGDEAFNATWAAGKQLSLDDAVAFALTLDASPS